MLQNRNANNQATTISKNSLPPGQYVVVDMRQPPPSDPSGGGHGTWSRSPSSLFSEKAVRSAFVRKVFTILSIQLVFSSILIAAFVLNSNTKSYFAQNSYWMWPGFGIFFLTYLILVCVESARRTVPLNFILLTLLTVGYGSVAAIVSCQYSTQTILFTFIATAFSCLIITLLSTLKCIDITDCGCTLCVLGLVHLVLGIVLMLVLVPMGYGSYAAFAIAVTGALLVSIYLLFDLQLIMGGRKVELSPEEYILGAVLLYTDIVALFIYLLQIIGSLSD